MVDLEFSKPVVALISTGRSFQIIGAAVEKARSPTTGTQGHDWVVFHQKFHETVCRQAVKDL